MNSEQRRKSSGAHPIAVLSSTPRVRAGVGVGVGVGAGDRVRVRVGDRVRVRVRVRVPCCAARRPS